LAKCLVCAELTHVEWLWNSVFNLSFHNVFTLCCIAENEIISVQYTDNYS